MRTIAVLPVKRFASAKQRLGEAVGGDERAGAGEAAMVGDVLAALAEIVGIAEVVVVTAEDAAAEAAEPRGRDRRAPTPWRPASPPLPSSAWSGRASGARSARCSFPATVRRSTRARSPSC